MPLPDNIDPHRPDAFDREGQHPTMFVCITRICDYIIIALLECVRDNAKTARLICLILTVGICVLAFAWLSNG